MPSGEKPRRRPVYDSCVDPFRKVIFRISRCVFNIIDYWRFTRFYHLDPVFRRQNGGPYLFAPPTTDCNKSKTACSAFFMLISNHKSSPVNTCALLQGRGCHQKAVLVTVHEMFIHTFEKSSVHCFFVEQNQSFSHYIRCNESCDSRTLRWLIFVNVISGTRSSVIIGVFHIIPSH